jgi:hypothetical protein
VIAFIHDMPPWVLGVTLVALSIGYTVLGIEIIGRWEPAELRHTYNDIVGFVIAVVGVVYAVLLAWVAIAAWETFDKADMLVEREASALSDMTRLAQGLPAATSNEIRAYALAYGNAVITDEWPAMRTGVRPQTMQQALEAIHGLVISYQPRTTAESNIQSRMLGLLTDILDARRDRLYFSEYGIHRVVWGVAVLGMLIMVGLSFMFGIEKRRHQMLTGSMAVSTALILFMIVEMDRPFMGRAGVDSDPFVAVIEQIERQAPLS